MAKENISKMKKKPIIWKIYLQMVPQTRVSSPKYMKNSHDSTPGRPTIQLKMVKGPEQIPLQGGHTEGPETYEKMLSITSHQRDAN